MSDRGDQIVVTVVVDELDTAAFCRRSNEQICVPDRSMGGLSPSGEQPVHLSRPFPFRPAHGEPWHSFERLVEATAQRWSRGGMQELEGDHVADCDLPGGDRSLEPFADERMVLARPDAGVS